VLSEAIARGDIALLIYMATVAPLLVLIGLSAISSIIQSEIHENYSDRFSAAPRYYKPGIGAYVVLVAGVASVVMFIVAIVVVTQGIEVTAWLQNAFLILFVPGECAIMYAVKCLYMWYVDNKRKGLGLPPKPAEL